MTIWGYIAIIVLAFVSVFVWFGLLYEVERYVKRHSGREDKKN